MITCKVCVVQWVDASIELNAMDAADVKGLTVLSEVGWLIKENDDYLTLAIEHPGRQSTRLALSIPKSRILNRAFLPVPKRVRDAFAKAKSEEKENG
jgi:hypothetical protein